MLNQTTKFFATHNNSSDKLLFQRNIITYLKLLYDKEIRKNFTTSRANTTKTATSTTTIITSTTTSPKFTTTEPFVSAPLLSSTFSNECDYNKFRKLSEDYATIWKIAFFTLAFITTFVALIVIVTLIIKIISTKLQRKPKNRILDYKPGRKDSSKTSCASLLDYDTGVCTLSSSSNYGLSSHQKDLINSATASNSLFKKENLFKSSNAINSLPIDNRCFIYGISNKMLIDDFSNFYNIDTAQFNSSLSQLNTIPTSFRPNSFLNSISKEKPLRKKSSQKKPKLSKSCADILVCNEYDAIETPLPNVSSTISAATSYSEVSNEFSQQSPKNNLSQSSNENDVNFHYLNNNELISSTSFLTKELESKLKERRQLIESRSKLLEDDDSINKRQIKGLSLSNLIPEQNETIKNSNSEEKLAESTTISISNTKCVCPCHVHTHAKSKSDKKHYRRISSISSVRIDKNSITEAEEPKEQANTIKISNKKARIVIDSSSKLPTKRESIRMLIENKAVTENKQKDILECHFNHIKQHVQKQI